MVFLFGKEHIKLIFTKNLNMKRLGYILSLFVLLCAFTCENEPLEGEFTNEEGPNGGNCDDAAVAVGEALLEFLTATDENYTELCNAYRDTLEAALVACGDEDGSLQQAIDDLGDCTNDDTSCAMAQANTAAAEEAFNNATDDNYTQLCEAYVGALAVEIFTCLDPNNELQDIIDQLGDCTNDTGGDNLTLTLNGVLPLDSGLIYEGWIEVSGNLISIGRFNTTSTNFTASFSVNSDDLLNATSFILSIEEADNDAPGISATKLLDGDFDADTATLTFGDATGLIIDPNGDYNVFGNTITPTDGTTNPFGADEDYGFWFQSSITSGLFDLPTLNEGWKYEGWVVFNDNIPLSTGQFTEAIGADDSSQYSGPFPGNQFPGEDFLTNLPAGVDGFVPGNPIIISIEPDLPSDVDSPFYIQPVTGNANPEIAGASGSLLDTDLNINASITGTAVRQ